jgi:hypothetical protein
LVEVQNDGFDECCLTLFMVFENGGLGRVVGKWTGERWRKVVHKRSVILEAKYLFLFFLDVELDCRK